LVVEPAWVEALRARLPELPDAKIARYMTEMGLEPQEARVLAEDRGVAEYFDAVVAETKDRVADAPRIVANWVTGELFRLMNVTGAGIGAVKIAPAALAELLGLVSAGQINLNSAKKVFGVMFETGRQAPEIIRELGLAQVSDADALAGAVSQALTRYPAEVARYRDGDEKLFGWLMGQVMRETRGKGNPAVVTELLVKALKG
jgi:aspartyl-tRNA(Asn)/glutamyl-tRNA(Gln) amidotransferase subunit B